MDTRVNILSYLIALDLLYWHGHVLLKQDPKICSQSGFRIVQLGKTRIEDFLIMEKVSIYIL